MLKAFIEIIRESLMTDKQKERLAMRRALRWWCIDNGCVTGKRY